MFLPQGKKRKKRKKSGIWTLEWFRGFRLGEEVILTVKYADELMLLLHGMIDRLMKIRRYHGIEMNVEKTQDNQNLKGTVSITEYDRSETTGECGIFQPFG
jgi:hypothetical protein